MLTFNIMLFVKNVFPIGKYQLKVKKKDIEATSIDVPAGIYFFKVSNRNTRPMCEVCSKLTIKTPEQHQNEKYFWCFDVDFE